MPSSAELSLTSNILLHLPNMITSLIHMCTILDFPRSLTELVPDLILMLSLHSANTSLVGALTDLPLPLAFSLFGPPPSICAAAVAKPYKKSDLNDGMVYVCMSMSERRWTDTCFAEAGCYIKVLPR
jgi:hypothetical protein